MPTSRPLYERLNEKIDRSGGPDACWPWTAATVMGYGVIGEGPGSRKLLYAHRVAWEQAHGRPVPKGKMVLHRCDNHPCCNDRHLFLGTQKNNMQDCASKDRHSYGTRQPGAKLTDEKVREMRRRAANGETSEALARCFGVGGPTAWKAINKITWKHVKERA